MNPIPQELLTALLAAIATLAGGYVVMMRKLNQEREKYRDDLMEAIKNLAASEDDLDDCLKDRERFRKIAVKLQDEARKPK